MKKVAAVILAAGQGKRMKSALPKVAHPVAGKPMLWRVAAAARAAGISEIVFVLGPGREILLDTAARFGGKVAVQERQLGTGDAAGSGLAVLPPGKREVVVLCGDAPLIRPATIRRLVDTYAGDRILLSKATVTLYEPAPPACVPVCPSWFSADTGPAVVSPEDGSCRSPSTAAWDGEGRDRSPLCVGSIRLRRRFTTPPVSGSTSSL